MGYEVGGLYFRSNRAIRGASGSQATDEPICVESDKPCTTSQVATAEPAEPAEPPTKKDYIPMIALAVSLGVLIFLILDEPKTSSVIGGVGGAALAG